MALLLPSLSGELLSFRIFVSLGPNKKKRTERPLFRLVLPVALIPQRPEPSSDQAVLRGLEETIRDRESPRKLSESSYSGNQVGLPPRFSGRPVSERPGQIGHPGKALALCIGCDAASDPGRRARVEVVLRADLHRRRTAEHELHRILG